ncbi:unnamed protein product [Parnassius mnemosyne]|uniref:RNA-directed DNA polymerase n=1 Tax=Parnassius mnemosyne TaxID=213953 RepID=A0AAV1K8W8_9NEOP
MSIGKISEFKVATDNWKLYVERLEQFFVVNKISSELHVPTLITVMGAESYELLVSLCTPEKPTSKTFLELTKILENYLQPKPSELAERFKFRQRKQRDGESISEYVTDLKKMSKTCEFGSWLQESLRDQFVCGISSETIRQRLFAESKLDFGKAYRLAVSMEAAEKDAASVDVHPKISGDSSASTNCYAMVSTRRTGRAIGCDGERRAGSKGEVRMRGRASRIAAATPTGPRVSTSVLDDRRRHQRECRACGNAHDVVTCKFARYVCRVCNKQGHLQRMCPYLAGQHSLDVVQSETDSLLNSEVSDEVMVCINQLSVSHYKPLFISLTVHGRDVQMECDTGSAVSCISYELYKQQFSNLKLNMCPLLLRYYTGEQVKPVGVIRPLVKYKDKEKHLDLYVIKNGKSILLGRQWLAELNIQLPPFGSLNCLSNDVFNLNDFSSRYCKVFADGLGRFTGPPVSIRVREGAQPVFMRARPLAYALRAPVERALEQLMADGILTPVDRSDWATPIVPVVKKDGNIRICADYKLTLNKVIEVDRYPLPRVEDLLVRLQGGQRFSKIDLSQAYAQFVLDESAKYTVINTHKGLFRYNRLVYGLSSSPGIFQKHLEQLFNLPYVGVFLDDIIITGRNTEEHISNLHKVFDRLQSYGLRVKKEKCVFFAESVNYLGYVISKDGIHTCPDKIKAIVDTPVPTNVRNELYLDNGSIMWGYRMVIPSYLRPIILKQLHSSHMGIVKTKGLARSYVWWPNIDADVEALCRSCETCASEADAPPRAPPNPWPYLPPWSRVHIDFLGPYKGKTYLVLIDSSSKWLEIIEVARTNATSIVKVLRSIFARFGLPLELVSDQGPPFTSIEFKSFLKNNGIQQRFSPAYHPASNGAAENAVKLCKRAIKKAYRDDVDIDTALQTFLLSYRNSKQSSTGESPAMLLQRRSLRSRLDLLRGGYVVQARVLDAQQRQVEYAGGVPRNFSLGDTVWSRDYGTRDKWVKGTVAHKEGSGRYVLDNGDGRLIKRHIDQIRRRSRLSDITCPDITNEVDEKDEDEFADASSELQTEVAVSAGKYDVDTEHVADTQCPSETVPGPATPPQPPPPSRPVTRSRRIRKPVIKFQC